jgi:hypothetical protein
MKFLSRLVEFKILVNWGMVHYANVEAITPKPNKDLKSFEIFLFAVI